MCFRKKACSSGCRLYGLRRDDSAAAMHCLAYSDGWISIGIETLGRTLYFGRCFELGELFEVSRESTPIGDVALLDTEERDEENSEVSVIVVEVNESRAHWGLRCRWPCGRGLARGSDLKSRS